jgi:hypothetical protein
LAFIYHVQLNNENSKVPFRMEWNVKFFPFPLTGQTF